MQQPGKNRVLSRIGWREWVGLPGLGIARIKAKVDTGARSSSLHAFALQTQERDGKQFVRFKVHPLQRQTETTVIAEAEVLEYRRVRSSTGHLTIRPVISAEVELLGERWPIELTLVNRDEMGFRMLLGREAVRGRWLVDAGRSYYGGTPARRKKKKKKKKKRRGKKTKGKLAGKTKETRTTKKRQSMRPETEMKRKKREVR